MDGHDRSKDILRHELIGLRAAVAKSTDRNAVGLSGEVIDETRNMLFLMTTKGRKSLPKDGCTFIFTLPDGRRVTVLGSLLVSRPEDRVKKRQKTW